MRLLLIFFSCLICLQIEVFAELSSSSCSLLRTATSITTMFPEIAQLAMRYYRVSSSPSSSNHHHRQKRFLFTENVYKDNSGAAKGSVLEQMVANAFKDVDFSRVVLLILNNNESMNKMRQNVDGEAIVHAAMRNIDYDKLSSSLWYAAQAEFDLEKFISAIINITHINIIHEELITTGVLPDWLMNNIQSNLNVRVVHQMFETMKNLTRKFITIMNSSEDLDGYLFQTIQQQALIPLGDIIQKVNDEKPVTLDQFVEVILNNVNKVVMETFTTTTQPTTTRKMGKKSSKNETTTMAPLENTTHEDVKLLLYQYSVAIDSIGQTARVVLKALEQLYCTSVWE